MTKKQSLMFGDVVKDPGDDSLYVAVSGATALNNKKQYTLFLRVTNEFHCLCSQFFPHSRAITDNFIYVENIKERMEHYLEAMGIKHNKELVKAQAFQVKSRA